MDSKAQGMLHRRATLIQLGRGKVAQTEVLDGDCGAITQEAVREICISAVLAHIAPAGTESVEDKIQAFFAKAAPEVFAKNQRAIWQQDQRASCGDYCLRQQE